MRTIESTVYTYDELSDTAKTAAREWYAEGCTFDFEFTKDDFHRVLDLIGFSDVESEFSGFYSQGDGASFSGIYEYNTGAVDAVRDYCPPEETPNDAAIRLNAIAEAHHGYLHMRVEKSGYYSHSGGMRGTLYVGIGNGEDEEADQETEDTVMGIMRELADWYYKNLDSEYEYQTSNEQVEESILANEYEFEENGHRV